MARWFPSKEELSTPEKLERSFRQMLTQHYSLVDRTSAPQPPPSNTTSSGPPPGSGPADSMLLGLRVLPVDTQTLADGVKLTFVKKDGNFQFK
jgi:hypothetical protein